MLPSSSLKMSVSLRGITRYGESEWHFNLKVGWGGGDHGVRITGVGGALLFFSVSKAGWEWSKGLGE